MNFKLIITLIIIIILNGIIGTRAFGFKSRMKGVKEKAKEYFKSGFGKKTLNFLGLESSDYPGTNPEYRKINKDKWQIYYDCLGERKQEIASLHTVPPEAKIAVVGGYIRFIIFF